VSPNEEEQGPDEAPEHDDPDSPGNADAVRRKAAIAKFADDEFALSIKGLMTHPQGRKFLWHMLKFTRVYAGSFSQSTPLMAFNEGQRNVGLMLMAEIHRVAPDKYVDMIRENHANDEYLKPSLAKQRSPGGSK
jgi:hypothetical protein